ncbi:TadE/TadG family type IV pilus assembly protein [Enterovirga rhinocerotis]|uniref:Flp pilus assembly protein TadG n=1 Tax=Enterovirga rhinocerotis TaxID=1339210 RepID=A0A4R7CC35_9HYPH|nr:TadE/TadG family type IV pilus assembly protein [Enterovirga rhinocerotis]TDR94696.1 Flp pilus assembly protein TadG [Enterovirga rhinocerotis]
MRAQRGASARPISGLDLTRRFRRSQRGATAVEFALILGPFLFALLATLEIAMVFWKTQVLETAVANASRQIYTGQFQTNPDNKNKTSAQLLANFKGKLCENVTALFNCQADISVDVRDVSAFAGATPPDPVSNGVFNASGFSYAPIGPGAIGIVTVATEYKSFFPSLSGNRLKNGNRLIMATAVFRSEPYGN